MGDKTAGPRSWVIIAGLGLYMAFRSLSALALKETVVDPSSVSPLMFIYVIVTAALIVLALWRSWYPRRWMIYVSGVACAVGSLLFAFGGVPLAIGYILMNVSYPFLTICFGLTVCGMSNRESSLSPLISLAFSVVVCALITAGIQLISAGLLSTVVMSLMPVVAAMCMVPAMPDAAGLAVSQQKPSMGRKTAVALLAVIAIGYVLSSILNGIVSDYFSLSSTVSLVTYLLSAVLMVVTLLLMQRTRSHSQEKLSFLSLLPFMLLLCIVGLVGFTSLFSISAELSYSVSFVGITLFYLGSWLLCPLIIQRSTFKFIPAFGVVSIICTGSYWKSLGAFLARVNGSVFSGQVFGVVTVLFLAVVLIVYLSKLVKGLVARSENRSEGARSASDEAVELADRFGLSEREQEVCALALEGYSASKIGDRLFVSESTVRFHLKNIYRKCAVSSKQELLDLVRK